jgi:uncharacterized protein YkwD
MRNLLIVLPMLLLAACGQATPAATPAGPRPRPAVTLLFTRAAPTATASPTPLPSPVPSVTAMPEATSSPVASADAPTPNPTRAPDTPVPPQATATQALVPIAPAASGDLAGMRAELIALHNQSRAEQGLPAYAQHERLQQAAQAHADFLAQKPQQELFSLGPAGHTGANGSRPADRVAAAGYAASAVDENWAYYRTVKEAYDWWIGDQFHRPQILSKNYTQIGFGIAPHPAGGIVFVAVFGRPR